MNRITIFGRDGCGFCKRAQELCELKDLNFNYVNIHNEGISKSDIEITVGKPVKTVPQVFHGSEYIGGYTELASFLEQYGN